MEQKNQKIAVALCLALFAVCFVLSIVFSKSDSSEWAESAGSPVILSEILPSNRTYPSPDGQHLDFVEVHNLSADAVDISGFMLSDDLSSIGYTFPSGTVLPPYGYAVCWCLPDSEDDRYGNFGISREGGETVCLYNTANVLIDQKAVALTAVNTSLVRTDRDTWTESAFATPGYPNTEEGYRQWLETAPGGDIQVTITEIMTDNSCVTAAPGALPWDWVELTNTGTAPAVLTGAYLSNDPADPLKWQIPQLTVGPGESAVIYCAGSQGESGDAPFGLSKLGCTLTLTGQLGNLLSQVECPQLQADHSWSLEADGSYRLTDLPTPGHPNTEAGFAAWLEAVGAEQATVVISEIMTSNRSSILSEKGLLCDWVELTNTGAASVCLDGAYLSDDPAERGKWSIAALTLEPGQSAVIPCAGNSAAPGEAPFALDASGCTLILSGSAGNILHQVTCPPLDRDRVWALQSDGTYRQTDLATPGLANTGENYNALQAARNPLGALAITEVMPANDRFLIQSDGRYYDWVELTNISGESLDLSGFSLSKDAGGENAFRLPQKLLKPGERTVILCSAREGLVGKYTHAPFTLSAEECWVYVTDSSGAYSDYLRISGVPAGCSMGRGETGGICYFTQPTPGRENPEGVSAIARMPEVLTAPGIYNGVSSISVELTGPGTLHYTTDGSIPTQEDPVYTGPLALSETTVLRAVSYEPGQLPSGVLTASYILNEEHTLPVISLAADPEGLFGEDGIYGQNLPFDGELLCSLALFEEGGSFSIDGGLEMMATGTAYPEKRSMKVNFRGRYGESVLGYPLFGGEGPQIFDALCLQAGSDHGSTLFRDELFTQLCLDLTENVPVRHYKFCVLYINGNYWGIYSLKEDVGETLYSQAMEVAEADVTLAEEPPQWGTDLYALTRFCGAQDMSDPENFGYLTQRVDPENLIDWMILQGYCCNEKADRDLRYFRTPETGDRWQLGFFDLDGGFTSRTGFACVLTEDRPCGYLYLTRSIAENPQARQVFLERLRQALNTALSSEHVLSRIDNFEALLAPEIQRERDRWGSDPEIWQADVDRLRTWITRYDHEAMLLESLREYMGLTEAELALLTGA